MFNFDTYTKLEIVAMSKENINSCKDQYTHTHTCIYIQLHVYMSAYPFTHTQKQHTLIGQPPSCTFDICQVMHLPVKKELGFNCFDKIIVSSVVFKIMVV